MVAAVVVSVAAAVVEELGWIATGAAAGFDAVAAAEGAAAVTAVAEASQKSSRDKMDWRETETRYSRHKRRMDWLVVVLARQPAPAAVAAVAAIVAAEVAVAADVLVVHSSASRQGWIGKGRESNCPRSGEELAKATADSASSSIAQTLTSSPQQSSAAAVVVAAARGIAAVSIVVVVVVVVAGVVVGPSTSRSLHWLDGSD